MPWFWIALALVFLGCSDVTLVLHFDDESAASLTAATYIRTQIKSSSSTSKFPAQLVKNSDLAWPTKSTDNNNSLAYKIAADGPISIHVETLDQNGMVLAEADLSTGNADDDDWGLSSHHWFEFELTKMKLSEPEPLSEYDFHAVRGAKGRVWAAGSGGTIVQFNGDSWHPVSWEGNHICTDVKYKSIWAANHSSEVWAVGSNTGVAWMADSSQNKFLCGSSSAPNGLDFESILVDESADKPFWGGIGRSKTDPPIYYLKDKNDTQGTLVSDSDLKYVNPKIVSFSRKDSDFSLFSLDLRSPMDMRSPIRVDAKNFLGNNRPPTAIFSDGSTVWAASTDGNLWTLNKAQTTWDKKSNFPLLCSKHPVSPSGLWVTTKGDKSDIWVVGNANSGDPNDPNTTGVIAHFDGANWICSPGIAANLNAVWADACNLWAVGDKGTIRHVYRDVEDPGCLAPVRGAAAAP